MYENFRSGFIRHRTLEMSVIEVGMPGKNWLQNGNECPFPENSPRALQGFLCHFEAQRHKLGVFSRITFLARASHVLLFVFLSQFQETPCFDDMDSRYRNVENVV